MMMLGCVMLMGYYVLGNNSISGISLLFLIACPLMHLFMMKGMHGQDCNEQSTKNRGSEQTLDVNQKPELAQKEF